MIWCHLGSFGRMGKLKLRRGQCSLGNFLWKLAWPGGSPCHLLKESRVGRLFSWGSVMLGVSDLATSTGSWVTWVEVSIAGRRGSWELAAC